MGLKAGTAIFDITPPLGISVQGYFEERHANWIHDPLFCRAFAIEGMGEPVVIAICDNIGIERKWLDSAKLKITEVTGLQPHQVLIACTHTHTGPEVQEHPYSYWLVDRIVDTVRMAFERRQPSSAGWATTSEPRCVFNRRYRMKDGSIQTNPGAGNPDVVDVAGPVDPDIITLGLKREDGSTLGVLSSYALHYVGVPDDWTAISADYFGVVSKMLQHLQGEEFVAALANGACGDINNWDVLNNPVIYNANYEQVQRVAALVAAGAFFNFKGATYVDEVKTGAALREVEMTPRPPVSAEDIALAEDIEHRLATGGPVKMGERSFQIRVRKHEHEPYKAAKTWVQALRVGDLGIVGVPGEYFVELGLDIRQRSPFKHTMLIELANDCCCYIPTREAFDEGAYEPESSPYLPGYGELMADTAIELLNELAV